MFGICRIPQPGCDTLSQPAPPNSPDAYKVMVMVGSWCYTLQALRFARDIVSIPHLENGLRAIVRDAESQRKAGAVPLDIGSLSADDRDKWAGVSNSLSSSASA
jgi:hypothetical protein